MYKLRVKFYLGQNEDCSLGGSISDSSEKLLLSGSGGSSVQFSHSVVSDSLRPHESQHVRPPCPSPSPRVHSDSCPSSPWCHPAISSSVVPFSSCPPSLPASGSFPISQLFAWGGQSIGVSALASFLPKKSQANLLQNGQVGSPCSPRDSHESSPTITLQKKRPYFLKQTPYIYIIIFSHKDKYFLRVLEN